MIIILIRIFILLIVFRNYVCLWIGLLGVCFYELGSSCWIIWIFLVKHRSIEQALLGLAEHLTFLLHECIKEEFLVYNFIICIFVVSIIVIQITFCGCAQSKRVLIKRQTILNVVLDLWILKIKLVEFTICMVATIDLTLYYPLQISLNSSLLLLAKFSQAALPHPLILKWLLFLQM